MRWVHVVGERTSPLARRALLAAAAVPLVAASCLSGDPGPPGDVPDLDALPVLTLEEFARIGSVDDPDYGFSRPGALEVDADGNVYVLELQDREIRVYSPDGTLLRRFGGEGDGPGEFAGGVSQLRFGMHGDTVWVFDQSPGRLTVFDREGRVLSASRVAEVSDTLHVAGQWVRLVPGHMDSSGLLVGARGMSAIPGRGGAVADTAWIRFVRFDGSGEVVDTLGAYPVPRPPSPELIQVGSSRFVLPRPPGRDRILVTHAHGYIHVDQAGGEGEDRFRLTRLDRHGDTIRSTMFHFEPRPFPDEVLNDHAVREAHRVGPWAVILAPGEGVERLESHAEDTAAARQAILREMPFPRYQSPVHGTFQAAGGALWLRREDMGDERFRYTVLDPDDVPVGELEIPRTTRLGWSDGEILWAIEPDELEVPWLVGYRIVGGG